MFTCLLVMLTLSFGLSMIMTFSPISLGVWILVMSMMISMVISTSFSSWFGFIMFLIYIGGMLVMFAYFVSIQPNQEINLKTAFFFLLLSFFNLPVNMYPVLLNLMLENNWWISSLFFFNNMIIIVLLGFVLFLALVMVVKITTYYMAALRPFNYV